MEGFPARAWKVLLLVLFFAAAVGTVPDAADDVAAPATAFLLLRLLWRRLQTAAAAGACLKKSRSKSVRDEVGQRQNGQNGFRLITDGTYGNCNVTNDLQLSRRVHVTTIHRHWFT